MNNEELLFEAASRLEPLLPEIVFVGGCATGMLITDPAAAPVRLTNDADVIVEVSSCQEYMEFSERLRALGFVGDQSEGAPLCRWNHGRLTVDVMPLDEKVLGFSNPWYPGAIAHATEHKLKNGLRIRMVTAPYFLATKFEAFRGRGQTDVLASHDLEDIISVVDGREELLPELRQADAGVRAFISKQIAELISDAAFENALEGFLPGDPASQARIPLLRERLRDFAELGRE
jgi:hypothetical protein